MKFYAIIRKLMIKILIWLTQLSVKSNKEWTRAMRAEMNIIGDDKEAVAFGFGCIRTLGINYLKARRFEPLLRWSMVILVFSWAGAKAYLTYAIAGKEGAGLPSWFIAPIIAAGIIYLFLGISLWKRHHFAYSFFLVLALGVNALLFGLTQVQYLQSNPADSFNLTWHLAVISEEYFVWSAFFVGGFTVYCLGNCKSNRSGSLEV